MTRFRRWLKADAMSETHGQRVVRYVVIAIAAAVIQHLL